jgi:hypothetical protein
MMSIMGCSADELGHVLFSLGFRKERRPLQVKPVTEPAVAAPAASVTEGEAVGGELTSERCRIDAVAGGGDRSRRGRFAGGDSGGAADNPSRRACRSGCYGC